jgi:hypothetical protein
MQTIAETAILPAAEAIRTAETHRISVTRVRRKTVDNFGDNRES